MDPGLPLVLVAVHEVRELQIRCQQVESELFTGLTQRCGHNVFPGRYFPCNTGMP